MESRIAKNSVLGIGIFSLSLLALYMWKNLSDDQKKQQRKCLTNKKESIIYPPLPPEVVALLSKSKLCFLATASSSEPHLSLMNFTYYQSDEVIIVCTRRNTKKYSQLQSSSNVSLLIHDFPHLVTDENDNKNYNKQFSITLNGIAECLEDKDELSIMYRSIHLKNNPDYSQFISENPQGDIAVIVIRIDHARICNILDQVKIWNSNSSQSGSQP